MKFAGLHSKHILVALLAILFSTDVVVAQQSTAEDIANVLSRNSGVTRGLRSNDPKAAQDQEFVDRLRNRSTRDITVEERTEVAEIARDKPAIDLEIGFDYNSANIGPKAMDDLIKLGTALRDPRLQHTTILLAGHTDAKGSHAYNKDLSDRRAEAAKQFLVSRFSLSARNLIAIGYGKERLKNIDNPFAPENRRVQVVNLTAQ